MTQAILTLCEEGFAVQCVHLLMETHGNVCKYVHCDPFFPWLLLIGVGGPLATSYLGLGINQLN